MALTDILFDENTLSGQLISEIPIDVLNTPQDIVYNETSIIEIEVTYPDIEDIVNSIWSYPQRTLTI